MAKKKYITKEDQVVMVRLIDEYLEETKNGEFKTKKSDIIMNRLYVYIDKIILGIINKYKFYRFHEYDDLQNVARWKIWESIIKQQFDPTRGTIFNFFSAVVAQNLYTFTFRENNKVKHVNDFVELESVFSLSMPVYYEDYDKVFSLEYIFKELYTFFNGKPRFQKLADVFRIYFKNNIGKKFVKKDFIEFARTYTFSDSFCGSFFEACKKIRNVSKLLEEITNESHQSGKSGVLISTSKTNNRSYKNHEGNEIV